MKPDAEVRWRIIAGDHDEAWDWTRVLYMYVHPNRREILYLGKSDGTSSSVRSRWRADDKSGFWRDIERERGVYQHLVVVGDIVMDEGYRLSKKLLEDIESLLIFKMQPWGNTRSTQTPPPRPGLIVKCVGDWPGPSLFEHFHEGEPAAY